MVNLVSPFADISKHKLRTRVYSGLDIYKRPIYCARVVAAVMQRTAWCRCRLSHRQTMCILSALLFLRSFVVANVVVVTFLLLVHALFLRTVHCSRNHRVVLLVEL